MGILAGFPPPRLRLGLPVGQLEGRNLRELQKIAAAGDAILQGKLEEGTEILLQRWKRVEAVATGVLRARAAEHLEPLPPTRPMTL